MRGQVQTMQSSYIGLGFGILGAIVLVYLLIVVNFQSWLDPLIIISALPAALAGIAWILILTGTDLSVPALTGAIMTMGVATANSILVIAFARQRLDAGLPPLSAALEAGGDPAAPGTDDGAGDDPRHDSDGDRPRRGIGTECAAGPRRHRRLAVRNRVDPDFCSRRVRHVPPAARRAQNARPGR